MTNFMKHVLISVSLQEGDISKYKITIILSTLHVLINISGKLYHLIHSEFEWNNISDYFTEMNINNCVFWHIQVNIQNKNLPPPPKLDSNGRPHSVTRAFNRLKCLGWFLHLEPTAGFQITTLILDFFLWRGISINIPWNIY